MARRSRSSAQCSQLASTLGELLHDQYLARRLTTRSAQEEAAGERRDEADYLAMCADDDDLARQPAVLIEVGNGNASLYSVEGDLLNGPKRLAEWQRIGQLASQWKGAPPIPDDAPAVLLEPMIYYHGGRGYSIDGRTPITVNREQHHVLHAFLVSGTALTTAELEKCCGNPAKVLRQIAERDNGRFATAVRRPGGKGAGGYYVRVRQAPQTKEV